MKRILKFGKNRSMSERRKRRGGVLEAFIAIALLCSVIPLAGWDTAKTQLESEERCTSPQPFPPMGEVSWELLTDARTVWEPGDYVQFENGWGTQFRDGVAILEFEIDQLARKEQGFRLLDATINDLRAMVKEEPAHCNFFPQAFSCHVGDYYCGCYYGDASTGEGAGCHCGHVGSGDDEKE